MRARAGLLLLLLAAPLLAQERYEIAPDRLPAARARWYGLYVSGVKSGWNRTTYGLTDKGVLLYEEVVEIKLANLGRKVDWSSVYRCEFDPKPPYRLRTATSRTTSNGETTRNDIARGARGYTATLVSPGGTRTMEIGAIDLTFPDIYTPMLWAQRAPHAGDTLVVRDFDVGEMKATTDTLKITAVRDVLVEGVRKRFYEWRMDTQPTGDTCTVRIDTRGTILSAAYGGVFEVRLETEKLAKRIERSMDLFRLSLVRVDRPLGAPTKVTELVLEVSGEGAKGLASGPRQTWDGKKRLSLGAAHAHRQRATKAEIREALEATVAFPCTDPTLVALARSAIGDAASDRAKVARLIAFVDRFIEDELGGFEATSALDILERKKGDCTEHAMLLTALARAAGIPARSVSGLMYMGDGTQAFAGHAWNEVVIDGYWVPVDAAWNETEIDATHISFGHGQRGENALDETLGRLTFRLIHVTRRP